MVRMNYQEARPEHLGQQPAGLNMCTRWLLVAIMILVIRSTLLRMMIRLMVANRPSISSWCMCGSEYSSFYRCAAGDLDLSCRVSVTSLLALRRSRSWQERKGQRIKLEERKSVFTLPAPLPFHRLSIRARNVEIPQAHSPLLCRGEVSGGRHKCHQGKILFY